jgi:hypothetical protein
METLHALRPSQVAALPGRGAILRGQSLLPLETVMDPQSRSESTTYLRLQLGRWFVAIGPGWGVAVVPFALIAVGWLAWLLSSR